jgi:hypothetical protein
MEKDILQSKLFKGIILGIAGLIILVFVFGLGVFVGCKRAEFSFRWAEAYHRNFAGPQEGFLGNFMGMMGEPANANGSFGQIIKIDLTAQTLTIKDAGNIEKNILVSNKTTIIYQRKSIKLSGLKLNDNVVVIGEPDDGGQIQAELIRLMPPLQANSPSNNPPQNSPGSQPPASQQN